MCVVYIKEGRGVGGWEEVCTWGWEGGVRSFSIRLRFIFTVPTSSVEKFG